MADDPTLQPQAGDDASSVPPPAQAAPQPAPAAAVPAGAPPAVTTKNPTLHNFVSSVLGALSGKQAPSYSYDNNGKLTATPAPALSTREKIAKIADNALVGLRGSAEVPQGKSGLATVLSAAGAGAGAVADKAKGQDVLARAQAKEQFEQQEQAKLRKYETARQNALTMSNYFANKKQANDMNPMFAANESLYKAAKDSPELGVHAHEMTSDQLEAAANKDDEFMHTHFVKPMGWAPEIGADGQQVMIQDENGNMVPKFSMRMAVIDGTKDGKIKITPQLAKDFQEYGSIARIPALDTLRAGDEHELSQLLPAMNAVEQARKDVLQGWQHSELGWVTDKDGNESPVEINKMMPIDNPGRVRPLTVVTQEAKEGQAKTEEQEAKAAEENAKAKESLANANLIAQSAIVGNDKNSIPEYMDAVSKLPPQSQAVLRGVAPNIQASLLATAMGDGKIEAFPANPRKGSGQISQSQAENLVRILNPSWNRQFYDTVQKLYKDWTPGGPVGQQVTSQNQFLGHAGEAADAINAFKTGDLAHDSALLNHSLNWFRSNFKNSPLLGRLEVALEPVKDEWINAIKSGKAAQKDEEERANKYLNADAPVGVLAQNLNLMGTQVITRMDQVNEGWRTVKGTNAPNLVHQSALVGAKKIGVADQLAKYNSGGQLPGGMNAAPGSGPNTPSGGATYNGKPLASNVDASKIHTSGNIVIGWDPAQKTWVDAFTGQVYKQTPPPGGGQ